MSYDVTIVHFWPLNLVYGVLCFDWVSEREVS